jgi:hypothetical protein
LCQLFSMGFVGCRVAGSDQGEFGSRSAMTAGNPLVGCRLPNTEYRVSARIY